MYFQYFYYRYPRDRRLVRQNLRGNMNLQGRLEELRFLRDNNFLRGIARLN
jgi:hypothetical protein